MLKLTNITKEYIVGNQKVNALNGISVEFRKSEFVSILGQSGCGKTTLLNIIGGLDKATSGELFINGKSTKQYKDKDWDYYRNHSIGFVFQSYNLIPHQTVLQNVELALTLSGVSKSIRKKKAIEALNKVGLYDQINKKPNQLSGGQMQRVAIARALVNDPEILLADEPTGALDSETSIQVMDILKEISKEKLIIMVTHNPEIAEKYSSRIIKLLDGNVISDSLPYESEIEQKEKTIKKSNKKKQKISMSFFTALSLSFKNLLTKKARTILTSFAGSIGIIGIALILSLSSGINAYIKSVEEDTLSNYPLVIEKNTVDISSLMTMMMGNDDKKTEHPLDKVYSTEIMSDVINATVSEVTTNNIKDFKKYLDNKPHNLENYITDIQYGYSTTLNIYKKDTGNGVVKVNPSTVFEEMGMAGSGPMGQMGSFSGGNMDVWKQLIGNKELLKKQYDVIEGRMPKKYNEAIIIVDKNNEISDYTLYALGLKDRNKLKSMYEKISKGKKIDSKQTSYSYEKLLKLEFKLVANSDYYKKEGKEWVDIKDSTQEMKSLIKEAESIKIVGIVKPSEDSAVSNSTGFVGYTSELMQHLINKVNKSDIVKEQKKNKKIDVFTNNKFLTEKERNKPFTIDDLYNYIDSLEDPQKSQFSMAVSQLKYSGKSDKEIVEMFEDALETTRTDATYDGNLAILGVSSIKDPATVSIYPKDFASKEKIVEIIDKYNATVGEEDKIEYTDYVGIMMSSITTIINSISYILIAFVAISLIVSSIMIGIITYISVLERTKEIGVLRSIGASKKDISRVFNAETIIIGFISGIFGIGLTLLLIIPINSLIHKITELNASASLPPIAGLILILISMLLTYIAGQIPSRIAAKKDPVIALRTE